MALNNVYCSAHAEYKLEFLSDLSCFCSLVLPLLVGDGLFILRSAYELKQGKFSARSSRLASVNQILSARQQHPVQNGGPLILPHPAEAQTPPVDEDACFSSFLVSSYMCWLLVCLEVVFSIFIRSWLVCFG